MKRQSLYFCGPEQVEVREEDLGEPGEGQAQVQVRFSGISAGTEMLFYRGQVPGGMALDETITSLSGSMQYPFQYGYASVGQVQAVGRGVDETWLGREVFSFHPHESAYNASVDELLPIPDSVGLENAVFLPNMETAVNFIQDGRPMIGEKAAVFGLGVVGLLTTALLRCFPLGVLLAFDPVDSRRAEAEKIGATSFDPSNPAGFAAGLAALEENGPGKGADLVFEVSGSPRALDQAVALAGFAGRVVIGSWYGTKPVSLELGGRFHRSRIRLISSQVSTLAADLGPRWDKSRRMEVAWSTLEAIEPRRWITHRFPFAQAAGAYALLAETPERVSQVVLEYD